MNGVSKAGMGMECEEWVFRGFGKGSEGKYVGMIICRPN